MAGEASAEEIVTRFTADISDLEAGVAKAHAGLKKFEDFAEGAAASGQKLNSSVGSLTEKTVMLEQVQRQVISAEKEHVATLGKMAAATKEVTSAQAKVGDVKGFQAAGKAADEEARRIDALIQKIQQLRAAHAQAGNVEIKAKIATDISGAQDQLRSIPIPQGATNTADIQAALAPLQEIQQQAPQAAAAVDKAAKDINADLAGIGVEPVLVTADIDPAKAEIDTLKAVPLDVPVNADTAPAQQKIDALDAEPLVVPVTADASQVAGELSGIADQGTKAFGDITTASLETLRAAGQINDVQFEILSSAQGIADKYKQIVANGEAFPGELEDVKTQAALALENISGIAGEEGEATRIAAQLSDELKKVGVAAKSPQKPLQENIGLLEQIKTKIDALEKKRLTLGDPKEIASVNAEIKRLTTQLNGLTNAQPKISKVGTAIGQIRSPLKELGGGLVSRVTGGLGQVGQLFSALTGPIGLAVAGIGAFILNATRLDSIKTLIEGVKIGFGGFLDQLAAGKFSISGIIDSFREGKELAEEINALGAQRATRQLAGAEETKQVESLLRLAKDHKKTEEERIGLLKEAQRINKEGAAKEEALALKESGVALAEFKKKILDQNKLTTSDANIIRSITEVDPVFLAQQLENIKQFTGDALEIDDEARQKAVDAQTKVIDSRRNAAAIEETAQNRISALQIEAEQDRERAAAKAQEAEQKRIELSNRKAAAEQTITDIITQESDEQIRVGLKANDQEQLAIDQKYDDIVVKAKAAFTQLRQIAGEGTSKADTKTIDELNKRQIEAIKTINAGRASAQRSAQQKAVVDQLNAAKDGNKAIEAEILRSNTAQLQLLRDKIARGEALTEEEQKRLPELVNATTNGLIAAAREKYQKLLDENKKFNADSNGLTEKGKKKEGEIIAARDAEILDIQKSNYQAAQDALDQALENRKQAILNSATTIAQTLTEIALDSSQEQIDAIRRQSAEEIGNLEEKFAEELRLNEEQNSHNGHLSRKGAQEAKRIQEERDRAIAAQKEQARQQEAAAEEEQRKKQRAAIIGALLDILEAELNAAIARAALNAFSSPESVATFGGAGAIQAAVIAALLKGIFAAIKSKIAGAYTGEERVGVGEAPMWSGKDGYLRRVHKNEGIVDARTNMRYLPLINAMRDGSFEDYLKGHYVIPAINRYLSSDDGRRTSTSVMWAPLQDANIVSAQKSTQHELKKTNKILLALLKKEPRIIKPSRRSWN